MGTQFRRAYGKDAPGDGEEKILFSFPVGFLCGEKSPKRSVDQKLNLKLTTLEVDCLIGEFA